MKQIAKKGQGVNTLSVVAFGLITFIIILFIGFKMGQTLLNAEVASVPYDGVDCNATLGCGATLAGNATSTLLGTNGLGLVVTLSAVVIVAVIGFAILGFFGSRRKGGV